MFQFRTRSPEETHSFGKCVAEFLLQGHVVCLYGDLGAGKTLLVQGIAEGLQINIPVTSPTFTIVNVYEGKYTLYHFDLYRLDFPEELADIGYYEYTSGDGIAIIEWPDKFPEELPLERLQIEIHRGAGDNERVFHVTAVGNRYQQLCEELKEKCPFLV